MQRSVTLLSGRHIVLRPLELRDAGALVAAAADGELWNLPYTVVPDARTVNAYITRALEGYAAGHVLPFATTLRAADGGAGEVIGSTRFWKMDAQNRKLEIGHTWIAKRWQKSAVNTEAKYLMLRHAFETLSCVRVQFTTDVLNEASRAAILRLGAMQEGVVRHERIMPDGRKRDSVRFSIIDDEWPEVKAGLERRLAAGPA
jgi:RimJ/RimL family protein N-acetyltransferase